VEPDSSAASWKAGVENQHGQRRASDRHSNDRPEADISSMRQLVTEAPRMASGALTALQNHARAKEGKPINIAICGPIIGKPF
jgi:hypothetical protein